MMRYAYPLAALLLLNTLTACQYFTYYKTNTTNYSASLQSSPEVTCRAMGAESGNAMLDWCVAEEEAARAARPQCC